MSDPITRRTPIMVLASRVRREEKAILAVLDRRRVPYEHVDTRTMWVMLAGQTPRWRAVLNREISHTRALYAALALEEQDLLVINSSSAIELCGDKWRTSMALRQASVPTPRTALALTPQAAAGAMEDLGYPVLVKPLVSSWGKRIALVRDAETARTVLEYCEALPSPQSQVIYLQELIDKPGRDIRVVVVGGLPLGAVYRYSSDWRTNVARGAATVPCPLTAEIAKLAIGAAEAVGAEIAGVDLLEDADGELSVIEVNHGVEFSGFGQALSGSVDVAEAIVDHVLARAAA